MYLEDTGVHITQHRTQFHKVLDYDRDDRPSSLYPVFIDGIEFETVPLELTTSPFTNRSVRAVCRNTNCTVFDIVRCVVDFSAYESVDAARNGPAWICGVRNADTQLVSFQGDDFLQLPVVG